MLFANAVASMETFTKDIENASTVLRMTDDEQKSYADPFRKEDRVWVNLYLIEKQLSHILWTQVVLILVIAAGFYF